MAGRGLGRARALASEVGGSSAPPAAARALEFGAPSFQGALRSLGAYWAEAGCAEWLPHNSEVGAGTMNPGTFLRALGPEPWSVAYAEPSVRPDDSRYGENPNRVQRHTQFQVLLKPAPADVQELYLGSLEALGVDTRAHDVRFVEDNWESPVLGAWGLGWEVWLDGMEVSQFTYFQQTGSLKCDPVAVEITYGLERILMALQGVQHFRDIIYADTGLTYGEMFLQNEYEMSCYNLDAADLGRQRSLFDLHEAEAQDLLQRRLPLPAYDHVLKTSHAFNVLDARGAIGVAERAEYFKRMRKLARECALLWVERREELGFPLCKKRGGAPGAPSLGGSQSEGALSAGKAPGTARKFVLEVGMEELPPDEVDSAVGQLEQAVPALLEETRLSASGVAVSGTPRRLVVEVEGLAPAQEDREERLRGPPASVAFDVGGEPTKALIGFCKKNGVEPAAVEVVPDAKGVGYCWAVVRQAGQPAGAVLEGRLADLVAGLDFRKSMRWHPPIEGGVENTFSRPVRWLVALHGENVVPFEGMGLASGRISRGLRDGPVAPVLEISSAEDYRGVVEAAGVVLEGGERRQGIWAAAQELAAGSGGAVPAAFRQGLLDEVANLVEAPTPLRGEFDVDFLKLPRELLEMVMRKHQRYFPVEDQGSGDLLPVFITVANGHVDADAVRRGNESVLRARFEDAVFFYESDCKSKLEDFVPQLEGTVFQKALGTLLDKTRRVERLVSPLAGEMDMNKAVADAAEAAGLARADLASATVVEMTALAGFMGRHYALKDGLRPEVAEAIFESVLPRQAGDAVAASSAGVLVSVADKLDSIVGLAAAGCLPKATADPFGLRRIAYGLLQTLIAAGAELDLRRAIATAAELQPVEAGADQQAAVLDFVARRLEQLLADRGYGIEGVRAVLAEQGHNPALAARSASEVEKLLDSELLQSTMAAYARPARLARGKEAGAGSVREDIFEQEEERALWQACCAVHKELQGAQTVQDFLERSEPLHAPIADFFEKVFVMSEDDAVRANRLALVRAVAALPRGFIDFSLLPGF